ncbi:hypothetical protein ACFL3S_06580 [Gemmatimonadota bacterium]
MRSGISEGLEGAPVGGLTPAPDDPALLDLAAALVEAGGGSVIAILLYGSHLQESAPSRWSAYDFLVIVEAYRPFYRSLAAKRLQRRPPWLLTALSFYLPPNIISFDPGRPDGAIAKCVVFHRSHFRRALRRHAPDHFLKGRVAQQIALVWSKGDEERSVVMETVRKAREDIPRWVRPSLPGSFELEQFAETMLRVSYTAEIRPEHPERVTQVFRAQRDTLLEVARESLEGAVARGEVVDDSGGYRWVDPPGLGAQVSRSAYFIWSKTRATARWMKYVFTFDSWLDYIQKKVERRAGLKIEVEEKERRWPLLFLWPKFFRVLRAVREASSEPASEGEEPLA